MFAQRCLSGAAHETRPLPKTPCSRNSKFTFRVARSCITSHIERTARTKRRSVASLASLCARACGPSHSRAVVRLASFDATLRVEESPVGHCVENEPLYTVRRERAVDENSVQEVDVRIVIVPEVGRGTLDDQYYSCFVRVQCDPADRVVPCACHPVLLVIVCVEYSAPPADSYIASYTDCVCNGTKRITVDPPVCFRIARVPIRADRKRV
ncbi:uncharacterized protein LOC143149658 [Ptiloglossa arizonensis]|uniref:uncharacterized protein LOC143149658 n=1 Tax=Ptiloglossa arizonensis TaxID=3350558 RepID=UPI003FA0D83C